MDLWWVIIAIVVGAVLGDTVNYWIGNFIGLHVFLERFPTLVKQEHIDRTYVFYEKYRGVNDLCCPVCPGQYGRSHRFLPVSGR